VLHRLGRHHRVVFSECVRDAGGNRERIAFVYDTRLVEFTGMASHLHPPREKDLQRSRDLTRVVLVERTRGEGWLAPGGWVSFGERILPYRRGVRQQDACVASVHAGSADDGFFRIRGRRTSECAAQRRASGSAIGARAHRGGSETSTTIAIVV
jgi:8-oxo-dGTP pyrophosphatase MutT (NUDIX family)